MVRHDMQIALMRELEQLAAARRINTGNSVARVIFQFFVLWLAFALTPATAGVLGPRFAYGTNNLSHTVSMYWVDASTGTLTEKSVAAAGGYGPRSIATHPTGKFAYVVNEKSNTVSVFSINASTGALTAGTTVPTFDGGYSIPIAIDLTGKFAYMGNSNSKYLSRYTIDANTGALTSWPTIPTMGFPVSIAIDPKGKFVYVANNPYGISVYSINATTGSLTPGPTVETGFGPRSIVIDPTGKFVYVGISNSVSVYSVNETTGTLTYTSSYPVSPSSIAIDPTGKFAYAVFPAQSEFEQSYIRVFSINANTGALSQSSVSGLIGKRPASIVIDPTGKFAYVANEGSNTRSVFSINASNGALTAVSTVTTASGPVGFSIVAGDYIGVPVAPTEIIATATAARQATVSFTPGYGGGLENPTYTVTSSPGGIRATGTASPILVTDLAAGSYTFTVTATNSVGESTPSLPSNAVTFHLTPQTIGVISSSPSTLVPGISASISAIATSGLPVSFSTMTPDICQVSGSTVVASKTGTCTLAANQAGNATYGAAAQVTQSFVFKTGQKISTLFLPSPFTIGTTYTLSSNLYSGTLSASTSSGLPVFLTSLTPAVCSVSGNTVTGMAVGTCTLAANQPGDTAFAAAAQITSDGAVKMSQTIRFTSTPKVYVDSYNSTPILATASSGLPVYISSRTPNICKESGENGKEITGLQEGTCTVVAHTQAGDDSTFANAPIVTLDMDVVWRSAVSFSTSNLTFPSQKVGAQSVPQSIVLTHTGGEELRIGNIVATGDFAADSACGSSLTAGSSCLINVTFSPTNPGTHSGKLIISHEGVAPRPKEIALSGTATLNIIKLAQPVEIGWNLLGNSLNKVINVQSAFGNASEVTTVWKWDAGKSNWQFYTPSLTSAALQTYAASKGYGVLKWIDPGDGYWINSKIKKTLSLPPAEPFANTAVNLVTGWNLVGIGNDISPSAFNSSLSAITPAVGMTTLWAWNPVNSAWYFYAPSLDASGGLSSYIASKGYLDFASSNKTLGNGTGFWVNATSSNTSPPLIVRGVVATGAVCGIAPFLDPDNKDDCRQCTMFGTLTDSGPVCSPTSSLGEYVAKARAKAEAFAERKLVVMVVKTVGTAIAKVGTSLVNFGKEKFNLYAVSVTDGKDETIANPDPVSTVLAKALFDKISPGTPIDDMSPQRLPPAQEVQPLLDKGWRGFKTVAGLLGKDLGESSLSNDPNFVADPKVNARDLFNEKVTIHYDSSNNVILDDKYGNNLAKVPLSKIADNTASGDAETISTAKADVVNAAWEKLLASCPAPGVTRDGKCFTCNAQQVLRNGQCVANLICDAFQKEQNGVCVPDCTASQEVVNGVCVTRCASNQTRQGGVCVAEVGCYPPTTPDPSKPGWCTTSEDSACGAGKILLNRPDMTTQYCGTLTPYQATPCDSTSVYYKGVCWHRSMLPAGWTPECDKGQENGICLSNTPPPLPTVYGSAGLRYQEGRIPLRCIYQVNNITYGTDNADCDAAANNANHCAAPMKMVGGQCKTACSAGYESDESGQCNQIATSSVWTPPTYTTTKPKNSVYTPPKKCDLEWNFFGRKKCYVSKWR